jgi:hypothetical protein
VREEEFMDKREIKRKRKRERLEVDGERNGK